MFELLDDPTPPQPNHLHRAEVRRRSQRIARTRRTRQAATVAGLVAALVLVTGTASRMKAADTEVTATAPDRPSQPTAAAMTSYCRATSTAMADGLKDRIDTDSFSVLVTTRDRALSVAADVSPTSDFLATCLVDTSTNPWRTLDMTAGGMQLPADVPPLPPLSLRLVRYHIIDGQPIVYGITSKDVRAVLISDGTTTAAVVDGQIFASLLTPTDPPAPAVEVTLRDEQGTESRLSVSLEPEVTLDGAVPEGMVRGPDGSWWKAPPAMSADGGLPAEIVRVRETCVEGDRKAFRSKNSDGIVRNEDVIDGIPNNLGTELTYYGGELAEAGKAWSGGRCAEMNTHLRAVYGPQLIP